MQRVSLHSMVLRRTFIGVTGPTVVQLLGRSVVGEKRCQLGRFVAGIPICRSSSSVSVAQQENGGLRMKHAYSELMKERSLQPNAAQEELVLQLGALQHALIECEDSGALECRRKKGYQEILDQFVQSHTARQAVSGNDCKADNPWTPASFKQISRLSFVSKLIELLPNGQTGGGSEGQHCTSSPSFFSSAASTMPLQSRSTDQDHTLLSQSPFPEFTDLRCLYIWGGVGQGKTMLMDAFYASTPLKKKARHHFHTFMLEIQQKLHTMHNRPLCTNDGSAEELGLWDPLLQVAFHAASETHLLCLDEFQVVHIADAMILKRLLEALWHFGCVVVATSNRPPADLYKGGLNRDRFLPFIELVQKRWTVFHLTAARDFRQQKRVLLESPCFRNDGAVTSYHCPPRSLTSVLSQLPTLADVVPTERQETPAPAKIPVAMGRHLVVPYSIGKASFFRFADLCDTAVGTPDFIALADHYHTLFLYAIAPLDNFEERPHEIRRFIELIDVLYERCVRIVFDADVPLLKLFGETPVTHSFDALLRTVRRRFPEGINVFYAYLDKCYTDQKAPMDDSILDVLPRLLMESIGIDPASVGNEVARVVMSGVLMVTGNSSHPCSVGMVAKHLIPVLHAALAYYVQFGCQDDDLKAYVSLMDKPQVVGRDTVWDDSIARVAQFNFGAQTVDGAKNLASTGATDNQFAAERCISRIRDMLSEDYRRRHYELWLQGPLERKTKSL